MNKNSQRGKTNSMKKLLSVALIAVMLSVTLVGCAKQIVIKETAATQPQTQQGGGVGLIVDPNQGDYVAPETEVQQGIAIPGWGELTIPPNQSENIVVDFYNPDANAGKYYLTFELYIPNEDGTKDVLYKSNLIEPGKHIQRVNFNHGLEPGEYEAVIHVQPYKMDQSLASTNNLDAKLKLIVK